MERNSLSNFDRGPPKELSSLVEICPVVAAEMSFGVFFSIFSSDSHFVQQSGMISTILVEDLPRNNPINFG